LGEAHGSLRWNSPALVIIAVVSRGLRDENLGDVVLGLIRTRADLHRWGAANAHGRQMHEAVDLLRDAAGSADPAALLAVVEKAIAAAIRVILHADDSSGIVGDAIRSLLELHVQVASEARPLASELADWMIKFQFDGTQDFFSIDVGDYAPVLGSDGLALYRAKLADIAGGLRPEPAGFRGRLADPEAWRAAAHDRHTRFLLEHNARRLAVVDRDVDAIIATHARDRTVAAWLQETAQALAEIGKVDLAIDWARRAADFDGGHQSLDAAGPTPSSRPGWRCSAAGRPRRRPSSCAGRPVRRGRSTATKCSTR
jgi:hypothetical protein